MEIVPFRRRQTAFTDEGWYSAFMEDEDYVTPGSAEVCIDFRKLYLNDNKMKIFFHQYR